jgi:hypothetical protein
MQSPNLSFAGRPRTPPNLLNSLDAASAIFRLNGMIAPCPNSMKSSKHRDEPAIRLIRREPI